MTTGIPNKPGPEPLRHAMEAKVLGCTAETYRHANLGFVTKSLWLVAVPLPVGFRSSAFGILQFVTMSASSARQRFNRATIAKRQLRGRWKTVGYWEHITTSGPTAYEREGPLEAQSGAHGTSKGEARRSCQPKARRASIARPARTRVPAGGLIYGLS